MKANSVEEWGLEHELAKAKLIQLITSAPVLRRPEYSKPFELTADASNVAIGAVLSQEGHPVTFLSKTFSDQEINWPIYEKEFYAAIYAARKWEHYLLSNIPFVWITDNSALAQIQKQVRITPKQA